VRGAGCMEDKRPKIKYQRKKVVEIKKAPGLGDFLLELFRWNILQCLTEKIIKFLYRRYMHLLIRRMRVSDGWAE
jgi:hypothetical protein